MTLVKTRYTFGTRVRGPVAEVRPRVEAALRAEGFGVLTEIDVAATMLTRLGVEIPPYQIIGACDPPLAHRAIEAQPTVGALLPCNVVIRTDGDETVVEVMDPEAVLSLIDDPEVHAVALDARDRLRRMIAAIADGGPLS
jgi:uncharacterized protein (DUF302 family)